MSTKDDLKREADSASQKLSDASAEMKDQARGVAKEAQQAATAYAEEGKQAAASNLNDFARAVRRASDELSERDQGVAARLVTEAADGLEKVANSVSGTSVDEMVSSVTQFARRNPGAFIVGSVLAGIALGRFAKATGERPHAPSEAAGYGRPGGAAVASRPPAGASSPATTTGGSPTGGVGPASTTRNT